MRPTEGGNRETPRSRTRRGGGGMQRRHPSRDHRPVPGPHARAAERASQAGPAPAAKPQQRDSLRQGLGPGLGLGYVCGCVLVP